MVFDKYYCKKTYIMKLRANERPITESAFEDRFHRAMDGTAFH